MPSPATTANAVLLVGLLSPFVALMIANSRWLLRIFLVATIFIGAAIWIVGDAVDAEAARPNENLDVQLGYAIDFWTLVFGGSLFTASFAVKAAWSHFRKRNRPDPNSAGV